MIHLDIDNMEKEELREFLQHCLNWLTVEIHHTDTRSFPRKAEAERKSHPKLVGSTRVGRESSIAGAAAGKQRCEQQQ